ncbi:MAG TPA: HAD hydrolase family protein [Saprospiraceae bacterium]|jgi:3-deoxy-D-manno-octulosonate 8-phosphate phosphatase (KDO 8-P phosphatase)|nr:MAG: HAD hydrolase family protein [Candidatus Parvibacillus calidus]HQP77544.1 HAD hydrolase family protein [Saprospiraceae bacterium]HRN33539.1 HAD hydrolase family protein [Saprospiraceae bacterium]HRP84414.1 HAD hydrolase family protein [Saprospiraceae bacterium]
MDLFDKMRAVKAFVFDVDGVMTDSRVHVWENGDQTRTMNTRDGFALKRAILKEYRVAVITGGKSKGVTSRLNGLGVLDVYSGIADKLIALEDFRKRYDVSYDQIMYMGDDLIDASVMKRVGLPAAPRDAVPAILNISSFVSSLDGGDGCVREIIEKIMILQGTWDWEVGNEQPGI